MVSVFVKRIGIGPLEQKPEDFVPENVDTFSENVVVHYGNSANNGVDYVHVKLCSSRWLADNMPDEAVLRGQNLLVMKRFDGATLRAALENYASKCIGETVNEAYAKVARLGAHEFEDYNDAHVLPTFFIDRNNESSSF